MGILWFGPKPFARICFEGNHVLTPVGMSCDFCEEVFGHDDHGVTIPVVDDDSFTQFHGDCFLRTIFGSVGHQLDQCECHGQIDTSEDGIPRREAATRAVKFFGKRVREGVLGAINPQSVN